MGADLNEWGHPLSYCRDACSCSSDPIAGAGRNQRKQGIREPLVGACSCVSGAVASRDSARDKPPFARILPLSEARPIVSPGPIGHVALMASSARLPTDKGSWGKPG